MNRLIVALGIAILAVGCGHDINNKDAVRQGVIDYLTQRKKDTGLDMTLMNVEIASVTYQKNEAKAKVSFKPKGSDSATGMTMDYVLERTGDKWVVKGRQESGMNPHGGQAMPAPATEAQPQMPPNHPPVDGAKPKDK